MKTQLFNVVDPRTGQNIRMQYPQTVEEAKRAGLKKYWPGTECKIHQMQPIMFISTGLPVCCTHEVAYKAYGEAIVADEPISAQDAMQKGKDYYINDHVFMSCGHYGKHTLTGKCYECAAANSPRQIAKREGLQYYIPESPCPRGHITERRVDNGTCKQCSDEEKAYRAKVKAKIKEDRDAVNAKYTAAHKRPIPFYKQFPDLVIPWKAAKEMGLNVYRTGEPCRAGHSVYRYVATRNCLGCMGR